MKELHISEERKNTLALHKAERARLVKELQAVDTCINDIHCAILYETYGWQEGDTINFERNRSTVTGKIQKIHAEELENPNLTVELPPDSGYIVPVFLWQNPRKVGK